MSAPKTKGSAPTRAQISHIAATEKRDIERRGSLSVAGSMIKTVPMLKRTIGTDAIGRSISYSW